MVSGLKRLLGSSRNQFGLAAIITTLVVMFVKWPVAPDGVVDEQILLKISEMQQNMLETVFTVIAVIVAVLTGGTSLEDAAKKLFGRGGSNPQ
jgi:fumarate reductase subunit D